jgi:malate/lactate dehydrogenase
LSQVKDAKFGTEDLKKLTPRIQDAGTEVVNAKAGAGSATLSMAWAGHRLAHSVMRALGGETVTEYTFVESSVVPGCEFFSSPVTLGKNGEFILLTRLNLFFHNTGVAKVHGFGTLSAFEKENFDKMLPELKVPGNVIVYNLCLDSLFSPLEWVVSFIL